MEKNIISWSIMLIINLKEKNCIKNIILNVITVILMYATIDTIKNMVEKIYKRLNLNAILNN